MCNRTWSLVVLFAVVGAVQLAFVLESHRSVAFQIPTVDSASYHNKALAIARGGARVDGAEPFWQPPLYPYFLAFLFKVFGTNLLVIRCLHALVCGVSIAFATFAVAKRVCSEWLAVMCGVSTCLYGPLLFFCSQLLPAGMAAALNMMVILALIRFLERPTAWRALAFGLMLGICPMVAAGDDVIAAIVNEWARFARHEINLRLDKRCSHR